MPVLPSNLSDENANENDYPITANPEDFVFMNVQD